MTSNRACSSSHGVVRKLALSGLSLVLAIAVAVVPEDLSAAPIVTMTNPQTSFARIAPPTAEALLVHCCHGHPLPPYTADCCHSGTTVYVAPGYSYGYGAASVRGQARRVSRRTSRRVSRR